MTNKEVIQLLANYSPERIVDVFEYCYHLGGLDARADYFNHKHLPQSIPEFSDDWLNQEYEDKCLFGNEEVEHAMELAKNTKELTKINWISVKDRLPKEDSRVIVYDTLTNIITYPDYANYQDGKFWIFGEYMQDTIDRTKYVTHWMPELEPPECM